MLFDDVERDDAGPPDRRTPRFDYLNISSRPEADRVRHFLERLFTRYPAEHQPALRERFRSRANHRHLSAATELIFHEYLVRSGLTVLEVEPELPNGSRPDFLVRSDDHGLEFLFEVTVPQEVTDEEVGAERRAQEVLQAIDRVASPDFFLGVNWRGLPQEQQSLREISGRVQAFVNSLDPADDVWSQHHALKPSLRMELAGMNLTILPTPKLRRGSGDRAIGAETIPGGLVAPEEAIRSALEQKTSRYGEHRYPLVIAINSSNQYVRGSDAIDAAFGDFQLNLSASGAARPGRQPNGAWFRGSEPRNQRCTALLFVKRLNPWSIAERTPELICNPWALRGIPENVLLGARRSLNLESGREDFQDGPSFGGIFELPEQWPE